MSGGGAGRGIPVALLSGGVGGAKLALGLYTTLEDPARLSIIANTGDDIDIFGLRVCPDTDILAYTLAGQEGQQGWGIGGDTFRALERVRQLGGTGWFNLGDVDIGLHLFRAELLAQGVPLGEITARYTRALGVRCTLLPMCEQKVTTRIRTAQGTLHLQEYLVRERAAPVVQGIDFEGAGSATPAPGVVEALAAARLIVVAPSNPLISIGPILAVPGLRDALRGARGHRVAVTPLVGGASLKGPTDKMLAQLGKAVSPVTVAAMYRHVIDTFVLDAQDAAQRPEIEALGLRCVVAATVMTDLAAKQALARQVLALAEAVR